MPEGAQNGSMPSIALAREGLLYLLRHTVLHGRLLHGADCKALYLYRYFQIESKPISGPTQFPLSVLNSHAAPWGVSKRIHAIGTNCSTNGSPRSVALYSSVVVIAFRSLPLKHLPAASPERHWRAFDHEGTLSIFIIANTSVMPRVLNLTILDECLDANSF